MNEFITYIDQTVLELQEKEQELASTDRKDEANLIKVQINVYGICKTVYETLGKNGQNEEFTVDYLKRMNGIVSNWREAYEKAKKHNDVEKRVIEELKLQAFETVKKKFMDLHECE